MAINSHTLSLSGGEISPLLFNRLDLEKRTSALAQCSNFLPLPYGGLRKRPGTKYLLPLGSEEGNTITFPFRGTDGKRYLILISRTLFSAYDIAAGTLHTTNLNWGLTTDQLKNVRWTILNDVIYIVTPIVHPFTISYFAATTWLIEKNIYIEDPEQDENLNEDDRFAIIGAYGDIWATSTNYVVGNFRHVTERGTRREYRCILNHTSNAARRPGFGKDWRTYWEIATYKESDTLTLIAFPGITTWNTSINYKKGDYVDRSGIAYRARVDHTSGSGTSPGQETAFPLGAIWRKCNEIFSTSHTVGSGTYDATFRPAARFSALTRRDERAVVAELRAIPANNGLFSPPILVSGAWTFSTFDTWDGYFIVQRSYDNGNTWDVVETFESTQDRNFNQEFTEYFAVLLRVGWVEVTSGGSGPRRGVITPSDATCRTRLLISGVTNTRLAYAVSQDLTLSGTTYNWTESAFNRLRGYPRAIALHERRLYYAGTPSRPLDLWASRIEDFSNFRIGTKDDDPIKVTLSASSQNPILWLASQRRLYIGTTLSEWVIGSENNDNPITPTNFLARQYTTYGSSENVRPILIGDSVIYLQRHDARLREMGYVTERETYDATDLTRLAEHLLLPNHTIVSMAWQESREPTLWCVISDGTLRTLTYIRTERVFAWARHHTGGGGLFISVAISPTTANDDEVYFITLRDGDYLLEVLPANAQTLNESGPEDGTNLSAYYPAVYDCQDLVPCTLDEPFPTYDIWGGAGQYYPPGDAALFQTFPTYEPGDNCPATISYPGGIPVVADIITLPYETDTQTGSSLGRKKRAHKLRACLHTGRDLMAADALSDEATSLPLSRASDDAAFTPPNTTHYTVMKATGQRDRFYGAHDLDAEDPYTGGYYAGWVEANIRISNHTLSCRLRHDSPTPCTITALVLEVEIYQP
jgi:hypothetical protein